MSILIQDVKLALRQLGRRPIFALTAVLTLAIGISANAVAFTVVNGILFRGSATSAEKGVGRIITLPGGDESGYASLPEYERFAEATRGAVDLAAEGRTTVAWRHEQTTEIAWALFVSPNYFSMVKARPIAGRIKVGREADLSPSVVIGERFWRRKLNAASLDGLTLRLNNRDVSVAGILPESFTGPAGIYSPDVWLPLDDLVAFGSSSALQQRDRRWLFVLGQVQPNVTVPEIQGRLDTAVAAMAREWPDTHRQRGARFKYLGEDNTELDGLAIGATVAMGIIGLVLLLACFNVANLLLARAIERERDMGIRAAVGARTARLVRLVITEGMVFAICAGAAALVLAWWSQSLVSSFAIPIDVPQHIDLTPDARVFAFVAGLVLIAGIVPGLWPALSAARVDVARVLGSQGAHASGGRTSPMRRWLVAAQVAGSTAFLAIAALFAQSYIQLSGADLGFEREKLLVAEFEPAAHGYDVDQSERHVDALVGRVRALPGVIDVAVAGRVPFFIGYDRETPIVSDACAPDDCPQYPTMGVGPGYFKTMGIPLVAGREFTIGDEARGVIVNQAMARQQWPNGGGLGETLRIGQRGVPVTVIGITARTHTRGLDRERPTLYVPITREYFEGSMSIVLRTASEPEALVRPVAEAAQDVDSNVPLLALKTMEQRMAVQLWPFRTVSWLFTICGALALILATVGLAGVVIYTVNRRLREFGVRVSVGATPRDLVRDVLRGSVSLLVPGLIAGTLLAAGGARLVQAAFIGVNVLNPLTYVAVALLQCTIVLVACIGPALRAAHVDPLLALRSE